MTEQVSPHKLITASRVTGTAVFNPEGERIGHVEDLSIDKVTGEVAYALMSFGGFLGVGERFHPLPWALLDYDPAKGGYVVSLDKAQLKAAPSLGREDLEDFGAGEDLFAELNDYYARYGSAPGF